MKPVVCFIFSVVTMIVILSPGCKPGPDEEIPGISILYPRCNSIISDTITIKTMTWDNVGVMSVDFTLEFRGPGLGDTAKYPDIHYTDHLAPYEYKGFNTTEYDDRTFVAIRVTARDSSNNLSMERIIGVVIDNSQE